MAPLAQVRAPPRPVCTASPDPAEALTDRWALQAFAVFFPGRDAGFDLCAPLALPTRPGETTKSAEDSERLGRLPSQT